MKKKKARTAVILLFSVFAFVFVGVLSIYGVRAGSLLNARNEDTIKNSLSENKENPIEILCTEKQEDYLAILYKSPLDDDPNDDYAHFEMYKKSQHYKNRYVSNGGTHGNLGNVSICEINKNDIENLQETNITTPITVKCFIYNIASNNETCSIYEQDAAGNDIRKLDEFKIPQTDFIIYKEYELLSSLHSISCDGSLYDDVHSFNEDYEKTDREQFEVIQKEQKEAEEVYKNAPWIDKLYSKLYSLVYDLWNSI